MTRVGTLTTMETERLLLRPSRVRDAGVYRQLWTERDTRVPPRRQIDSAGRPTVADIEADIRDEDGAAAHRLLAVEIKSTGEVVGYCGLVIGGVTRPSGGKPGEPELAYELLRSAHGLGLATEAGRAVVDWAARAGHQRLWATVRDWNAASRRVLDKLGFEDTGEREPEDGHGASLITVHPLR